MDPYGNYYNYPPPGTYVVPPPPTTFIAPPPPTVYTTMQPPAYGIYPPQPQYIQPIQPVYGYGGAPPPNPNAYSYPVQAPIPGANGYSNRSISGHKFQSGFRVKREHYHQF
ncbi:hypothetical protein DDB_G0268968 [Dictyostelium discoideum AX4]|uniref:Uncharacterized protein n=1 Tax=Dictyostelium discoideum TaxID=44689 RepID=Q55ET9_DICDI|nr:hypothetical protein DDB_G0268968 [Dictyostelium discoideum AX4]EAL73073.1 hypothetical protein DDB_G0268968 [Dictyostelium discoideum AX4]|eukprot:XP_646931.1 hypothetical protein DDB_G0268968 [Dictyostelium discoideum AX4]